MIIILLFIVKAQSQIKFKGKTQMGKSEWLCDCNVVYKTVIEQFGFFLFFPSFLMSFFKNFI